MFNRGIDAMASPELRSWRRQWTKSATMVQKLGTTTRISKWGLQAQKMQLRLPKSYCIT